MSCPNCNAEIASGTGNGDNMPRIFLPLFRCKMCGTLVLTGKNEYLTMPVEERINLRNTEDNYILIRKSLDRTCNKEYIEVLEDNGFEIFPLEERDFKKFPGINFALFQNRDSSSTLTTQELYNSGILIKEENKDTATGGVKKAVLEENQRQYNTNLRINKWSVLVGLGVGILFAIIFGSIDPTSALCLIGVVPGIASAFLTQYLLKKHYQKQDNDNDTNNNKKK